MRTTLNFHRQHALPPTAQLITQTNKEQDGTLRLFEDTLNANITSSNA